MWSQAQDHGRFPGRASALPLLSRVCGSGEPEALSAGWFLSWSHESPVLPAGLPVALLGPDTRSPLDKHTLPSPHPDPPWPVTPFRSAQIWQDGSVYHSKPA